MILITHSFLILVSVVFTGFMILCTVRGEPFRGFFGILGFVGFLYLFQYPVVPFVTAHWRDIPIWLGVYLLAGVPWAVFKWWLHVRKARKALQEWMVKHPRLRIGVPYSSEYAEEYGLVQPHPDESGDAFRVRLRWYMGQVPYSIPIRFNPDTDLFELRTEKLLVTTWMAYWPFSVVGTIGSDLVLHVWDTIYEAISGVFGRISAAVLSDVNR